MPFSVRIAFWIIKAIVHLEIGDYDQFQNNEC